MLIPNIIINFVGVFTEHKDNITEDKKIIVAVIKHGILRVIKNGSKETLPTFNEHTTPCETSTAIPSIEPASAILFA